MRSAAESPQQPLRGGGRGDNCDSMRLATWVGIPIRALMNALRCSHVTHRASRKHSLEVQGFSLARLQEKRKTVVEAL